MINTRLKLMLVGMVIILLSANWFIHPSEVQQDKNTPEKETVVAVSVPAEFEIQYNVDSMDLAEIYQLIEEYYGFTPELINAMICVESVWNPNATSTTGDYGLMQVNRKYWDYYYSQVSIPIEIHNDPFDPKSNIIVGATAMYLWKDYSRLHGDTDPYYFLNYYNAGYYPDSNNYESKVLGFMFE